MSPPKFLGDPCVHALLFDPGGELGPDPLGPHPVAFRSFEGVGPTLRLSRLYHTACTPPCILFADEVGPSPGNTQFRWQVSLAGSGLAPDGSQ